MTNKKSYLLPSPLESYDIRLNSGRIRQVFFKRDDLIHPVVSGNKWRKLKYNLVEAKSGKYDGLLTIGGAFSNHLVATAAVGQMFGVPTRGLVKTSFLDSENPTLADCLSYGMKLDCVGRSWAIEDSMAEADRRNLFWIDEGGSNVHGLKGVEEMMDEIHEEFIPDVIVVSVGSGGTLAGILHRRHERTRVLAVSSFAPDRIADMMETKFQVSLHGVELFHVPELGGFGKLKKPLIEFCANFYSRYHIPLDPIYTGKTCWWMTDQIDRFVSDLDRVVLIHTGGIQGWRGMHYRFPSSDFPSFAY